MRDENGFVDTDGIGTERRGSGNSFADSLSPSRIDALGCCAFSAFGWHGLGDCGSNVMTTLFFCGFCFVCSACSFSPANSFLRASTAFSLLLSKVMRDSIILSRGHFSESFARASCTLAISASWSFMAPGCFLAFLFLCCFPRNVIGIDEMVSSPLFSCSPGDDQE